MRSSFLFAILFLSFSITQASSIEWVGCGISKKSYMNDLAKNFKISTGIDINLSGGGATKGIRKVAEKTADMGGSCRYYLPDHTVEKTISFEPVAWDALAVITHKNNPVENISIDQLKAIYKGQITNWKQLGGYDEEIELLVREGKISGVGYMIRKLLFYDVDIEFPYSKAYKSSGPLEKAVEKNINAIAITGISSGRLRDLKILSLNGFSPDISTITRGHYLLYRPLYITYRNDSKKIKDIRKFIAYAHSREGRTIMKSNGVVPYLTAMPLIFKQIEQERIAQRNSTTAFSDN